MKNWFTYDDDGNMLTNGDWTYEWNAENRLIEATNSADGIKYEFKYDYKGRMFDCRKYSWVSSAWQLDSTEEYVWDRYNKIAVFDATDTLKKSMLWGEDLNGGFQTAGGVGGLLAITGTASYYPMYDGNGNIMAYVDGSGNVTAEYEYSPSSDMFKMTGTKAEELAAIASFSTKPYNKDLDAYFYQKRILRHSRWLSRDPLGEKGGVALYVMVNNNSINKWDYLGFAWKITRDGHAWAIAERESSQKDKFSKLANIINLDIREITKWLRNIDDSPIEYGKVNGCKFKIPNSFVIGLGEKGSDSRDDLLFMALRGWVVKLHDRLNEQGVNVIYINRGHNNLILNLQKDDVAGYALMGHGFDSYGLEGRFLSYGAETILPSDINRQYKFSVGVNYFCYAASANWSSISNSSYTAKEALRALFYWNWFNIFIGGYSSFANKYFPVTNKDK